MWWHSELRCHLQCQNAISTCSVLVVPLPSQFLTKPGPREAAAENGPSAQIAVPMRETWMKCLFPPLLLRYSTFKLNKIKIFDKSTLVIYLYDLFTWKSKWQRERQKALPFPSLLPKYPKQQGSARLKSAAKNFFWVCHVNDEDPRIRAIFHCLSRKLDKKNTIARTQTLIWNVGIPNSGLTCSATTLTPVV